MATAGKGHRRRDSAAQVTAAPRAGDNSATTLGWRRSFAADGTTSAASLQRIGLDAGDVYPAAARTGATHQRRVKMGGQSC